ncbi:MAG: tol-pal system protein YbgF [Desulfobacteraceae bacterium]|nr:tol-pal system protein YbgF [Desulfobacteraceae bacterium]MDH3572392.1 tol-pal system protein YbgF [Desulfobacteraceae bacterium]MDH3720700.1 tol-pal system protein YbgF [Desulfobacteraceae bacterium]MDH3835397.1 tol-pal system protein YbgF [Desulfobacteraceae bacterium]MDH3873333.1 tol-pal system protein YbgF [Desulfobacteraceae bacterium]
MKKKVFIFLLCSIILSGCALQRDVMTLDDRLAQSEQRYTEAELKNKKLEATLEEYRNAREQYDKDLRSKTAGQNATIDQLQEEIRILKGKLEETDYLLKQKINAFAELSEKSEIKLTSIDKTTSLNKDRIERLEQYLNFESGASIQKRKPASKKTSAKQVKHKLSENDLYRSAKQAYDKGDFNTAREGFQKLLKEFPKSENADNAQFWIGEIYYREKWYEKSILEYQKVIEKYPKGNKVTASLLKQGFAFFNLGDKSNARLILSELIKKYPKSNEAKIAERKLKGIKP